MVRHFGKLVTVVAGLVPQVCRSMQSLTSAVALLVICGTCLGEAVLRPLSNHKSMHELAPHTSHRLAEGEKNLRAWDFLATGEAVYQEAVARAKDHRRNLSSAEPDSNPYITRANLLVWDLYYPSWNCLLVKERVGKIGDGGKWLCGIQYLLQGRPCLIYSLGSAGETSFEESVHDKTSCKIHTFDHTLSQDLQQSVAKTPGIEFHLIGIGRSSGAAGLQTLHEIMAGLKHTWIDVLKVDIEGAEWEMLRDFYAEKDATLPVTQLLIEFHFPGSKAVVFEVLDMLHADGFRVYATETNYYCGEDCMGHYMEFSLMKVSPDGNICAAIPEEAKRDTVLPQGCFTGIEARV